MQPIKTVIKKHWPKLTIVLWLVLQLPFLMADLPDSLSYSRGPYSDEGLNTFAVRNFINSNFHELSESDNFIKSPVLNAYLFTPFLVFQNDLLVGRIAMLFLVALLLWQIVKRLEYGWLIVLLFSFIPILFHFSRLMMGDLTSVLIPLVGMVIYLSWVKKKKEVSFKNLVGLVLFASLAVGMKIQAAAVFAIFLASVFLIPLSNLKRIKRLFAIVIGSLPLPLVFLFVLLRQNDLFNYIYHQVPEYYQAKKYGLIDVFQLNWELHFNSVQGQFLMLTWVVIGFLILMFAAKFWWKKLLFLLPLIAMWLYQFSGMFMIYFPPRYLVGLYVASVVLLVVLITESKQILGTIPKLTSVFLAAILIGYPAKSIQHDYVNLQIELMTMNHKIAQKKSVVVLIGSWAPTLNFTSSTQLAYPIWDSYLTFKEIDNPVEYYSADLIIAEPNEDDSGAAYKKRDITLSQFPLIDSLTLSKFELLLYRTSD